MKGLNYLKICLLSCLFFSQTTSLFARSIYNIPNTIHNVNRGVTLSKISAFTFSKDKGKMNFTAKNQSKYLKNKFYLEVKLHTDWNCATSFTTKKFPFQLDEGAEGVFSHSFTITDSFLLTDENYMQYIKKCEITVFEKAYHTNKIINKIINNKKSSIFIIVILIGSIVSVPLLFIKKKRMKYQEE